MTLLYGNEIPEGQEHRIAQTLFEPPCRGGVEIGYLYPPEQEEDIRLRIIDSTTKTWLPMCGGMSQVIGLAVFSTPIHEKFNIIKRMPVTRIHLRSDSGVIPVDIEFKGGTIHRITTHMPEYARFLYDNGVWPVSIRGIPAMKVGYFLVFKMDDLKKAYPGVEFGHRRPGIHLEILGDIQHEYLQTHCPGVSTLYSMIYDHCPEADGDARIFTRFFKGKGVSQSTPLEVQCGTGTIAVGIAMAEKGELPFTGDRCDLTFEWGSKSLTTDPYGMRKSVMSVKMENGRIAWAAFSHNIVELQSMGRVYLPSFTQSFY